MITRTKIVGVLFALMLAFTTLSIPSAQAATLRIGTYATTTTVLNLRAGPSTGYAVLRVAPAGASVYVNAGPFNTDWYKVTYSGTTGYMYGRYLTQSVPSAGAGSTLGTATTRVALNLRSGPSTSHAVQRVIPAGARVTILSGPLNRVWHQVRYSGTTGYVHSGYLAPSGGTDGKLIIIDISDQWLYVYQRGQFVFKAPVSTGKDGFNTPLGYFTIFAKYPMQTMRGSMNGESWVVPDVPHVMYITQSGVALHGAYWHNQFGTGVRLSHGCINQPLDAAARLYNWAPLGTQVHVRP